MTGINLDRYVYDVPDASPDATPRSNVLAQIRTALVSISLAILSEAPATPYHAQRAAYAAQVIRDPAAHAPKFLAPILVNNGNALWAYVEQGSSLADVNIQNNVSAVWNALAGVVTEE